MELGRDENSAITLRDGTCLQEVPSLTLCFPKHLILSDPTHFVRGQWTRHHHSHFSLEKSESQMLNELHKGTNPHGPPCFCLSYHLFFGFFFLFLLSIVP